MRTVLRIIQVFIVFQNTLIAVKKSQKFFLSKQSGGVLRVWKLTLGVLHIFSTKINVLINIGMSVFYLSLLVTSHLKWLSKIFNVKIRTYLLKKYL